MSVLQEKTFQKEIIEDLQSQGWLVGKSNGYVRHQGIYAEDVLSYIKETQLSEWNKVKSFHKTDQATGQEIIKTLVKNIDTVGAKKTGTDRQGVLFVLRKGFKCLGAHFKMMQGKPENSLSDAVQENYTKNIFRVVSELVYSDRNENRLDLCLFVNGIPTATVELKTEFTQNVQEAITQYKYDRPPAKERLLSFRTGAVVHFAIDGNEAYMTTKLAGPDTVFLPFNKGNNSGAGNPVNPNGYATDYIWKNIWEKENWLDILQNYVHFQITKAVKNGKTIESERLIFPRYHQWDCVEKINNDVLARNSGSRYLVQHSAGSGKTNSIAWLAHKLSKQFNGAERKFSSVIVITDRKILDAQLQKAIGQIDPTSGVNVKCVDNKGGESKSSKLATFLEDGAKIIVVTLQTFPFALNIIANNANLKNRNFAIIADEAHSSQSGTTARVLRKNLSNNEIDEDSAVDGEDIINQAVENHNTISNISMFAFTATPKDKTLQIFGTLPKPDEMPSENNIPEAFHHYSMKQAIEEGFILNVLDNYTTYKTLYEIGVEDWAKDRGVDEKRGKSAVKKWLVENPNVIGQKAKIIIEHFRSNVSHLLNGEAKAMVVTSSRHNVVRYKKAFDDYLAENKITDIQTLVAFSGSISEDINSYTEDNMNGNLKGLDIAGAFDTNEYNILLVANKYQTGFDQPKLVAMYVDKLISNIEAVQTLSRLNRCYPGKNQTFILDFQNDADDIISDFSKYYQHTKLEGVSDPNHVYTIQNLLYEEGIFDVGNVEDMYNLNTKVNITQNALHSVMKKPSDIFKAKNNRISAEINSAKQENDKEKLKNAQKEKNELDLFVKRLDIFVKFYDFICQVIPLQDTDLEKMRLFCINFKKFIATTGRKEEIDIKGIKLDFLSIKARNTKSAILPDEDGVLSPTNSVGGKIARTEDEIRLEEIIAKINIIFGGKNDEDWKKHIPYLNGIMAHLKQDDIAMKQILDSGGDVDKVLKGERVSKIITSAVLGNIDKAESVFAEKELFNKLVIQHVFHNLKND